MEVGVRPPRKRVARGHDARCRKVPVDDPAPAGSEPPEHEPAYEGPHWRGSDVTPQRKYDPRNACHHCGKSPAAHHKITDHEFLSVEAARAIPTSPAPNTVRDAIVPMRDRKPTEETTNG